jgi:hypothetical protein
VRKNDFLFLLLGVSYACLKATEQSLTKKMSSDFKYNVYLNSSHDSEAINETYPEDDNRVVDNISDLEVVNLLFRDEKVPVWIDVMIEEFNQDFTVFKLVCSGRYSQNKDDLYYNERGSGSFGIKITDFNNLS